MAVPGPPSFLLPPVHSTIAYDLHFHYSNSSLCQQRSGRLTEAHLYDSQRDWVKTRNKVH